MKLSDTELECSEEEKACLEFCLSSDGETKEQWAKRVWDSCRKQSQGEFIARVYSAKNGQTWQERAQELWEEKKLNTRKKMCKHFDVEKDLSDQRVLAIKNSAEYVTAEQKNNLEKE